MKITRGFTTVLQVLMTEVTASFSNDTKRGRKAMISGLAKMRIITIASPMAESLPPLPFPFPPPLFLYGCAIFLYFCFYVNLSIALSSP